MGCLSDYFSPSGSGYAVHRTFLRRERLPACCRENLTDSGLSVKYLGDAGEETYLPLRKCPVCGRYYAVCGGKYMPADHLMRFEVRKNNMK